MHISHFSFLISHLLLLPLHSILEIVCKGALSSAGLEHLPYKQRVGGSNPSAPTTKCVSVNYSLVRFFFAPVVRVEIEKRTNKDQPVQFTHVSFHCVIKFALNGDINYLC